MCRVLELEAPCHTPQHLTTGQARGSLPAVRIGSPGWMCPLSLNTDGNYFDKVSCSDINKVSVYIMIQLSSAKST